MVRIAVSLLLAAALAAPASAQDSGGAPGPPPRAETGVKGDFAARPGRTSEERRKARLDLMFGRLAAAGSKQRADRIGRQIMRRLSRSGSATVDLLMERAGAAMQAQRYGLALDLLDGVVRLKPDFAEGWNRRATVHYLRGDYGASLADIEQVLRYEPRHWGALAGLSMILVAVDRKDEAIEVMDRALAIHPYLEAMKDRRDRLVEELAGSDI